MKCHLSSSFTKVGTRLMCGKCYGIMWPEDLTDFKESQAKIRTQSNADEKWQIRTGIDLLAEIKARPIN